MLFSDSSLVYEGLNTKTIYYTQLTAMTESQLFSDVREIVLPSLDSNNFLNLAYMY